MAGLTDQGFEAKSTETLLSEIEAVQRTTISTRLNTTAEGLIGSLNRSIVTKLRELWELAGIVYSARDPKNATFAALDAISQITGTVREAARRGLVTLEVRLGGGVTLPAGHIAHVEEQPTNRWRTKDAATNAGGSPAWVEVAAEADTTGARAANANTITVIATPFNGWLGVRNPEDASEGSDIELDSSLRVRREEELSRTGTSPVPAIQADLADVSVGDVDVVQSVFVEHNPSAYYDELHRPPHSVEAVVQFLPDLAGDDLTAARQAVAEQLWRSVAGGINTHGSQSATIVDSNGQSHTMRWTEPTEVDVWVAVTLEVDPDLYVPANTKPAILAFGDLQALGGDVIRAKLICALIELPGVLDVEVLSLGRAEMALRESNVTIGARELAIFDTGRITVTT